MNFDFSSITSVDRSWLTDPTTLLTITWLIVVPLLIILPQLCRDRFLSARDRRRIRLLATSKEGVIDKRRTACIALVNGKSGGQLGSAVLSALNGCLPPHQIYDLAERTPKDILTRWKSAEGELRVLVCGGDGTVGWVMNTIEELFPKDKRVSIGVLPMGTGNDLGRSFGWGSGVPLQRLTNTTIRDYLLRIAKAKVQLLDRWLVEIKDRNGNVTTKLCLNNYISIGIDAEIGLKFHEERIRHPERFSSQSKNIIKYALYGFEGAFEGYPIGDAFKVFDGTSGDEIVVNPHLKGIVFNNIPCYHGGKNFWGTSTDECTDPQSGFKKPLVPVSTADGLLEVMGLSGTLHIGLVHIAVDTALRLAQLPSVRIEVHDSICIQIDGEPLRIPKGQILVTRTPTQFPMLKADEVTRFFDTSVSEMNSRDVSDEEGGGSLSESS